jgi:hypothetical protein
MDSETLVNTAMLVFLIGMQFRFEHRLSKVEDKLKEVTKCLENLK